MRRRSGDKGECQFYAGPWRPVEEVLLDPLSLLNSKDSNPEPPPPAHHHHQPPTKPTLPNRVYHSFYKNCNVEVGCQNRFLLFLTRGLNSNLLYFNLLYIHYDGKKRTETFSAFNRDIFLKTVIYKRLPRSPSKISKHFIFITT